MRVVFFGSGSFAVPPLRWLVNSQHEVAAVVTQPDRPAGRGRQMVSTPLSQRAVQEGLPVWPVENVNDPAFIEQIRGLRADIGVVVDFGQKISEPTRLVFPSQCVNIHASLLPRYRGAAPVAWSILRGERKTGVSVFRLVDRMDAGAVLVRRETIIDATETVSELEERLAGIGCDALNAALRLHEREVLPAGEPQDESQASRAPKLRKSDGHIDFTQSAEQISRLCRAMNPWPGARCRFVGRDGRTVDVGICTLSIVPVPTTQPPGTISDIYTVATGVGNIEIHEIQPAGSRVMSWQDFVNGRRVQPGDRFESLGA